MRPLTDAERALVRRLSADLGRLPGQPALIRLGKVPAWRAQEIARLARSDPEWLYLGTRGGIHGPSRAGRPPQPPDDVSLNTATKPSYSERPRREDDRTVEVHRDGSRTEVSIRGQDLVMTPEDLVRSAGLNRNDWQVDSARVSSSATVVKGADNRPEVVRVWHVRASITPRIHLEEVQSRTMNPVADGQIRVKLGDFARCTLVVPDSQHGYRWTPFQAGQTQRLIPTHDPLAISCMLAVARELQPERIVLLGDMLDLPEWSLRWPVKPDRRNTTKPALAALGWMLDALRAAVPAAQILYLAGNHEERIEKYLNAHPLAGLEDRLTIPALLDLERRGVEYIGPYGAEYRADGARYTHGERVRPRGGATAAAVLGDVIESTWYGHIHRAEVARRTFHDRGRRYSIFAASPGCLTSLDGETPGSLRPDWQQGWGVNWYDVDYAQAYAEVQEIIRGRTLLDGRALWGEPVVLADILQLPVMDGIEL